MASANPATGFLTSTACFLPPLKRKEKDTTVSLTPEGKPLYTGAMRRARERHTSDALSRCRANQRSVKRRPSTGIRSFRIVAMMIRSTRKWRKSFRSSHHAPNTVTST